MIQFSPKNSPDPVYRDVPLLRDLGKEEVEHDDRDEAGDEAFGAGAADAACPRAAGEAFVASDQADRGAEEDGLDDAFHDLPGVDALGGVLPVRLVGHAKRLDGN